MQNIKKLSLIAVILMSFLSLSNFFGLNIAGITVIIGVVLFFINQNNKIKPKDSGLNWSLIKRNLKVKSIWLWISLPLVMDAVCILIAKLFLPEYLYHVVGRTKIILSFDKIVILILQLAFLALLEEIAWRAFFQKQINKMLSITPTLLITSLLFAFGHISDGNMVIVIYDIFFIFINSMLYGIIFCKTNNAWISALSHFAANLFSIIILIFL